MAGRPRKPTARHIAEGTATHLDRLNLNEPQYPVGAPPKPAEIVANPRASAHWDYIVPIMMEQRTLTTAFLAMLVVYCQAYADNIEASVDVESSLHQRICARTSLRQAIGDLGLNPVTSAKVSAAPTATPQSALAKIQNMGRGLRAAQKTV